MLRNLKHRIFGRRQLINSSLLPSERTTALQTLPMRNEIDLLEHGEVLSRLDRIISMLQNKLSTALSDQAYYACFTLLHGFVAERNLIAKLNDEVLACKVPWGKETNLPSSPSLAADIVKYAELSKSQGALGALLKSFGSWAEYVQDKVECQCGTKKVRMVLYSVVFQTTIKVSGDHWLFLQKIGVQSDDKKHIASHYVSGKRESNTFSVLVSSQSTFSITDSGVEIEQNSFTATKEFRFAEFVRRLREEYENSQTSKN